MVSAVLILAKFVMRVLNGYVWLVVVCSKFDATPWLACTLLAGDVRCALALIICSHLPVQVMP